MLPIIILLFEFVILAFFKSTGTTDVGNFFASVLILVHAFILLASFNQNRKLKRYSKFLIIGFLLRLLLLFVDVLAYPHFILPNGHADEDIFYYNAVNYADYGFANRGMFPVLMGRLFRIIGYNRLFGQYVCVLFSVMALILLVSSMELLDETLHAKLSVFRIVCVLPNFAILSSLFVRESIITMFLTASFYYFVKWTKEKRENYFLFAIALVFPAAALHSGTIAAIVGYLIARMFYDNKKETISISFTNILFTLIITFIAVYVVNNSNGQFTGKFGTVDSLEDIANTNTAGASTYAQYVGNSDNPINFILFTPLRLFFFLFSPVPWMWRGIADIIAFLFSSMYYATVLWSVLRYLRVGEHKNKPLVVTLFVVALAVIFVFAWGTSNAGTATRHRDKMVTLFALLWCLSKDNDINSRRTKKYYRKYHS